MVTMTWRYRGQRCSREAQSAEYRDIAAQLCAAGATDIQVWLHPHHHEAIRPFYARTRLAASSGVRAWP